MQPLKKKKKKKKKKKGGAGGGGELLIHSNFELYILHTYIRLCGTVHLLEFDQKQTHKKERTDEGDNGRKKEREKKKKKAFMLLNVHGGEMAY